MRTDAEKQAFAMKCLEIEKAGGDVREYIAKNWPSYTPRATWYNLQREYLKRNSAQLTEGKPDPEREEVKEMNKMRAVAAELVNNYADNPDADVAKYLTECGYTNLPSALRNLRQWAKTNEPGWLPDLQKCSIRKKVEKKADPDAKKVKKQIVERLDNLAKKIQESEDRTGKPSPTCCQPAPPSGVTVSDDLPEEPDGYQRVAAVAREMLEEIKTAKDAKPIYPIGEEEMVFCVKQMDSKLGTWEYNREKDQYIFASNKFDDQLNVLALSIMDWLNLAAEIPKAIRKLTEIME